jgi:hypothetical protein
MERDENWLPPTRSERNLPKHSNDVNYREYLEDSPIYTLVILVIQQLGGLTAYFSK